MRVLNRFVTPARRCPYLPDREARLEYTLVSRLSPEEYELLLDRGYRKFGIALFRPVCDGCRECRPIRIPAEEFRPDRSQRRAWNRNQGLTARWGPPRVDDERLELLARYHAAQTDRKGWPETDRDPDDYAASFTNSPVPTWELALAEEGRLRAVVIAEATPNVLSGVYHYYDPELRQRGLGTYCMLRTIERARQMGRRWAYFGYYVAGCGSLEYKARFRPCEVLGPDGIWRPM